VTRVTVYSRPGCHLCEQALAVVRRVGERIPFELEERNIESDDRLLARHLERIPVVDVDGRECFEFFVDEHELERALRAAVQ